MSPVHADRPHMPPRLAPSRRSAANRSGLSVGYLSHATRVSALRHTATAWQVARSRPRVGLKPCLALPTLRAHACSHAHGHGREDRGGVGGVLALGRAARRGNAGSSGTPPLHVQDERLRAPRLHLPSVPACGLESCRAWRTGGSVLRGPLRRRDSPAGPSRVARAVLLASETSARVPAAERGSPSSRGARSGASARAGCPSS